MKETILDVLLYLFEHYFYDDPDAVRDRDSLQNGLLQAGFSPTEINKAFDWLDELARQRPAVGVARSEAPVRVYVDCEQDRLDLDCRGFLMFLEHTGVIDVHFVLVQRHHAVDDLKWVVLMVLFNQPGSEAAYAWMESQMFEDEPEPVH